MSQMLQLDTLVTMLACLTTQQSHLGDGDILQALNSDNMTNSCPITALSSLTSRIQALSTDVMELKKQIGSLQEQLVDVERAKSESAKSQQSSLLHSSATIGTRFLDEPVVGISSVLVGAGGGPEPATPRHCLKQQHGVVRIRPRATVEPFFVFCDQKTRGGGWTVIANRYDGSEDFNRKWNDYKIGFGPLTTEFFIGLDKLHQITNSDNCELLVMVQNRKQEQRYALYDQFSIGSESEKYRLNVLGNYVGDAADALRQHAGKMFSTQDRDNDNSDANCAASQSAAFWYSNICTLSNPFGLYQRLLERDVDAYKGILWRGFLDGPKGSLKLMRMMVRPRAS